MSGTRLRTLSRTLLALVAFIGVVLTSETTTSSIPLDRPAPPSREEMETLMELYAWVLGEAPARRFRPLTEEPVSRAIESHRRSFEIFRRYSDRDERSQYVERMPYGRTVATVAERYGLDPLLVIAVIEAESGFDRNAVSPMGALGLMQVMPSTAEQLGAEDPFDPAVNIALGCRYLRSLLDQFDGDLKLALAGYNAGGGAVERFDGVPPYRETRRYVDRVLDRYVEHHRELWRQSPAAGWLF